MTSVKFKYENGDVLRDKVTGFTGVVMVRAEYSTGCIHFGIASNELKNGEPLDWHWFDQSRLELLESSVVQFEIPEGSTSGPFPKGPEF